MREKILVIKPLPHKVNGDLITRECEIKRCDDSESVSNQILRFEFNSVSDIPDDKDSNSYLLAILFDAMHEKRDIIIKGSVSGKLLSNLVEFQAVWHAWYPNIYHRVDIFADEIKKDETPVPGAVSAFSGGVDATFTVWRHTQKKWGHRSQDIKLCAMVHGFDIPLSDAMAFEGAKRKATKTLASINIPLFIIKTNYRQISKINWEHTFVCALVAALGNFKKIVGTCLIGSGHSYNFLDTGGGASPITDHLLSAGDFAVIHDGASHTRAQKVEEISDWKTGVENLRVCWQGNQKDRNCGECEKCLRTMLCFLTVGKDIPSCFPNENNILKNLKSINSLDYHRKLIWEELLLTAHEKKVDEPWVKVINRLIYKKTVTEILFPIKSYRRYLAKNLLDHFIKR